MRPSFRTALLALGLALAAGCQPAQQADAPDAAAGGEPGEVVAVLDGEPIREGDLEAWIRDDLYHDAVRGKNEHELHEFRDQALQEMVNERLVRAEAERRGVTPEALQRQAMEGAQVSDEEVRAFYDANAGRLPENVTFEAIAPRIRQHLGQQKQAQAWGRFVQELRSGADLEVRMEAPRAQVAAVGPALGAEDPAVTIVEFSDFECPFCKRVNPVLKDLIERYPDQVRIVFRHFPLDRIHPTARATAEAAVCADEQGGFWAFHDAAFEAGEPLERDDLVETAEGLGLDVATFEACLEDGRAAEVVQRDVDAGVDAGVTGTPAFFINGIRLSGAQQTDAFVRIIEQELARAGGGGDPPDGEGAAEETAASS